MRDFFEFVWGENDGYACIVTADIEGKPTNSKFFKYPEQLTEIVDYSQLNKFKDVWFTPTLWKTNENRQRVNAKALNVFYADADTFDIVDFHLRPSLIVETSPGRTHCYWSIEGTDGVDIDLLEDHNRAISIEHPKDETDLDTGWSLTKLLRVPYTTSRKHAEPFDLTTEYSGEIYELEQFAEKYPPPKKVENATGKLVDFMDVILPDYENVIQEVVLSAEARDVINTQFSIGNRSEPLFLAINNCFEAGASNEETFTLLKSTPVDKWAQEYDDPKASIYLWNDIQRTRRKRQPDPTTMEVADVDLAERAEYYFVEDQEVRHLQDSFIDRFVEWSDKRTNAARDYKQAAAFIILSTVFSDFGHINMNWGAEPLNLWFIISGGTTVDRKSTSKNQALKLLRKLEYADEDGFDTGMTEYLYDFSSDFSVEGMADTLLQRPHRSGVVTRDEFQGMLAEINSKNYKSGMKETLTDWYGGRVSTRIRSGKAMSKSGVPFALSFYAIGIDEQIVEQLTTDDFASGFLPRFLWVDPTDSIARKNSITDGFAQGVSKTVEDEEFNALVDEVLNAREYWEAFVDPEGETIPIQFTDEAWDRVIKFMGDMEKLSNSINPAAIPSVERMSVSTLKCAALMAMVDAQKTVTYPYVLKAIHFASKWFGNMIHKLNAVSDTVWKRQQDEVLKAVVSAGGSVTLKSIYSKVRAKYTPRDFSEILNALENSGYIRQENHDNVVRIHFTGGKKKK